MEQLSKDTIVGDLIATLTAARRKTAGLSADAAYVSPGVIARDATVRKRPAASPARFPPLPLHRRHLPVPTRHAGLPQAAKSGISAECRPCQGWLRDRPLAPGGERWLALALARRSAAAAPRRLTPALPPLSLHLQSFPQSLDEVPEEERKWYLNTLGAGAAFAHDGFRGGDVLTELVRAGDVAVLQAATVGVHKGDALAHKALKAATQRATVWGQKGQKRWRQGQQYAYLMPGREKVDKRGCLQVCFAAWGHAEGHTAACPGSSGQHACMAPHGSAPQHSHIVVVGVCAH